MPKVGANFIAHTIIQMANFDFFIMAYNSKKRMARHTLQANPFICIGVFTIQRNQTPPSKYFV